MVLLDDFPITVSLPVAWGDMDAFQHVNNVVYLKWFETVRIETFTRVGWMSDGAAVGVGPILARTSAVFRAPVTFPDTVHVGCRISDLAEDRFTMLYRVVSERLGVVAAEGDGRVISFDYTQGQKAPLPTAIRDGLAGLMG